MVLHGALMQRHTAHIQFTLHYHPSVDRKRWAQDRIGHTEKFHGRIGSRADIPLRSRVKGGTVFQIKPLNPLLL